VQRQNLAQQGIGGIAFFHAREKTLRDPQGKQIGGPLRAGQQGVRQFQPAQQLGGVPDGAGKGFLPVFDLPCWRGSRYHIRISFTHII